MMPSLTLQHVTLLIRYRRHCNRSTFHGFSTSISRTGNCRKALIINNTDIFNIYLPHIGQRA
ncbi:hypothetical protein BIFPSEUDO_02935 [Bifidobacterium pseudocatenulatum DSM 20438 = JCM 1200 = LMG 10505]|uniref:Uncharacterized protein n=1 Tax=Bifidobacterium pseudocatenulatum DSM 20438 = JCM 1200 = LMG 10505 TaxID=547043 RepID=C0BS20_BIFPS|nr:hypothetical protein BIFPSEUDO_02935 [Bifidobacterium pseudocatenulatum DSM 20438 = JCM 1200 = LMG 10505]BAR03872.1 hypothetical protein BBPC_1194 [Bifidobacterium pseudocatenulatum DSM 20438 = JCM 1200 = LMG 10505]